MKALLVAIATESKAIVASVLGALGHEQLIAPDGKSALDCVALHLPALVIVEDTLPDMTLVDFCQRVRKQPNGAEAVILAISHDNDELLGVLDAGATDLYATTLGPAALEMRVHVAERLVREHARLRDRELRFRRLYESGVAGVTIADLDGNFKEANDAFLQMLGYTHADLVAGRINWGVITPIERLVEDTEARAQLRMTGFLPLREREYIHKDGHHVAALVGSAMLEATNEHISYVADISERKRSEEQYRVLFESSPFAMFVFDDETLNIIAVNETAVRTYGYTRNELARMTVKDVRPQADARDVETRRHQRKNGTIIDVDLVVQRFTLANRNCTLAIAVDITDRNRDELKLRQSQKMDAIGNLAGGVAHDFNNLLSVILSYSEMLAHELKETDPMRQDLEEIIGAGTRAATLTRQLLAFSRQQVLQPRVLDLNLVLDDITKMLTRVLGEDIELTIVGGAELGKVQADPGQVEQILMNLVVNARDAMPKGGHLTIETANVELDSNYVAAHADVVRGSYVMLAVTDTGTGMDRATRERIFEPFFTTKEKGKGTGLGLSTVFGIVRQSEGHVWVYSEVGTGTTFKVYLPRIASRDAPVVLKTPKPSRTHGGTETILLVEDEDIVRNVTRTILERAGYLVLEARSGGDAMVVCEQHTAKIHVLLTDVVMPRMSGRQLAERLQSTRPDMKVLFMSGYTDDAIIRHGVLDSDVAFVQKPITPDLLTRKLREVIAS